MKNKFSISVVLILLMTSISLLAADKEMEYGLMKGKNLFKEFGCFSRLTKKACRKIGYKKTNAVESCLGRMQKQQLKQKQPDGCYMHNWNDAMVPHCRAYVDKCKEKF